jgi:hypothetical protein
VPDKKLAYLFGEPLATASSGCSKNSVPRIKS